MPEIVDLRPGVDISVGRRGGSGRARRPRVIGLFEKASTLLTSPAATARHRPCSLDPAGRGASGPTYPTMAHLVVVGNGMAGVACVEAILAYERRFDITIFGDETHVNYNRILLSSVLAGARAPGALLLATGSVPFMPRIEGLDRENVFTFRTLDDTRRLLERAGPGVKAVVVGGGLLGLGAARGLQGRGWARSLGHTRATP